MLTLKEVLDDAIYCPGFKGQSDLSVHSRGSGGETPLHWMATLGDPPAIRLLVEAGADINAADAAGNAALHEAVSRRQVVAVQELLVLGADISLSNALGQTAYDIAQLDRYAPVHSLMHPPDTRVEKSSE